MLHNDINNIRIELVKLMRGANVRDISYGDIYKSAPSYPAINIYLESAEQADDQVFQRGVIFWDLTYSIHCLFKGSEGQQTFDNTIIFVDTIYNILQSEQDEDKLFNDSCLDINCTTVEYGRTKVKLLDQSVIEVNGGKITMIVRIIEER